VVLVGTVQLLDELAAAVDFMALPGLLSLTSSLWTSWE